MSNARVWNPLNWKEESFADTAAKVQVGDAVRNPVASLDGFSTREQYDHAYRVADLLDRELAARGLRIDNTATVVGFVERGEQLSDLVPSSLVEDLFLLIGSEMARVRTEGKTKKVRKAARLLGFDYDAHTGEALLTDRFGQTYTITLRHNPKAQGIADERGMEGIAIRSRVYLPDGEQVWRATFIVNPASRSYDDAVDDSGLVKATTLGLLLAMKNAGDLQPGEPTPKRARFSRRQNPYTKPTTRKDRLAYSQWHTLLEMRRRVEAFMERARSAYAYPEYEGEREDALARLLEAEQAWEWESAEDLLDMGALQDVASKDSTGKKLYDRYVATTNITQEWPALWDWRIDEYPHPEDWRAYAADS